MSIKKNRKKRIGTEKEATCTGALDGDIRRSNKVKNYVVPGLITIPYEDLTVEGEYNRTSVPPVA